MKPTGGAFPFLRLHAPLHAGASGATCVVRLEGRHLQLARAIGFEETENGELSFFSSFFFLLTQDGFFFLFFFAEFHETIFADSRYVNFATNFATWRKFSH